MDLETNKSLTLRQLAIYLLFTNEYKQLNISDLSEALLGSQHGLYLGKNSCCNHKLSRGMHTERGLKHERRC